MAKKDFPNQLVSVLMISWRKITGEGSTRKPEMRAKAAILLIWKQQLRNAFHAAQFNVVSQPSSVYGLGPHMRFS